MTKEYNKLSSSRGSTLIEVLVATTVVVFALTALMSSLTLSIKSTAENKYRSYATSLAQEAIEVHRRERALLGWQAFYSAIDDGVYCYNILPSTSEEFVLKLPGTCTDRFSQVGTDFSRSITITKGPDSVTANSVVDWFDGENLRTVTLEQVFREY